MSADGWLVALALASVLHAGFSLTVTTLVYPALAAVPDDRWAGAHRAHSRRIVALVAATYAALLVAGAGTVVAADPGPLGWLAGAGAAGAIATTALAAAPTHGRLDGTGGATRQALLRRLLRVDRLRTALAVLGAVAAVVRLTAG